MKKNIYLILGVLGAGLVVFGVIQGWTGWTQKFGAGVTFKQSGFEYWQGIGAVVMAAASLASYFMFRKFAYVPGLIAIVLGVIVMLAPGGELLKPQFGLYMSMAGGLLSALGGFLVPKA